MKSVYVELINLGIGFLGTYLESLTKSKAPQEILDGVQAAITQLEAHKNDVMSAADWESQRG